MTDVLGNQFKVGDDVAYAAQGSASTYIVVGKLREIHDNKLVVVPTKRSGFIGVGTGRAVSISPKNVVILRPLTVPVEPGDL